MKIKIGRVVLVDTTRTINRARQGFGILGRIMPKPKWKPKKIWDMREHITWGDRIKWFQQDKGVIEGQMGFARKVEVGDELRYGTPEGKIARYKIVHVMYESDPPDKFYAQTEFVANLMFDGKEVIVNPFNIRDIETVWGKRTLSSLNYDERTAMEYQAQMRRYSGSLGSTRIKDPNEW